MTGPAPRRPAVVAGEGCPPPPWPTLVEALRARAQDERPWFIFHRGSGEEPFSTAQAWRLAQGWAAALREVGVKAGDAVAVLQPNGPDFVGAFFGAQLLDAVAVPLPWPVVEGGVPRLPEGAARMLEVASARAVCAPPGLEAALPVVSGPREGDPREGDESQRASAETGQADAVRGPSRASNTSRASNAAFIQFTSGSTGTPRGAVISQQAAIASAWSMGRALKLGEADVGVSWLPFFHDMGLVGVLLSSLVTRFPVHLLRPSEVLLHPRRWLELLSQVRATLTVAPNFGYELLVRRGGSPDGLDLSPLRAALDGSEPVLQSTLAAFEARFAPAGLRPGAVLPVYGLAENTLGVAFAAPGRPEQTLSFEGRQVPSVGAPLENTQVAVRHPDGTLALEGEEGELTVQGPSLMNGYHAHPEATGRALRASWLWTGDKGVVVGGRLYVTGREKDLVIKAGRKFHPADIERVVAEVVDTPPNGVAAFSVLREEAHGEELVVVVELRRRPTEDVAKKVRGKLVEALGVTADRVELVGAGDLPRTTSGKLRRSECALRWARPAPRERAP